ncbi:MAG: hypothetical protein WBB36_12875 [Chitinophagales bacterium]
MKKIHVPLVLICIQLTIVTILMNGDASAKDIKGSYWRIKKKDASVIIVKKMKFVRLDTLFLSVQDTNVKLPVDAVVSITKVRKGKEVRGAAIGAAVGFGVGSSFTLFMDMSSGEHSYFGAGGDALLGGLIFSIPGALAGGITGSLIKQEKEYDIETWTTNEKIVLITRYCEED